MAKKKITMTVEKTDTGFLAYAIVANNLRPHHK